MRQPGEPSVDEILDSIKKVIARDNRATAAGRGDNPARAAVPAPSSVANPVHDDAPEDDILDLEMSAQFLDADDDGDAPTHGVGDGAPLVTPQARLAMRESLAALAMMAKPGASPQIVRSGETSLEELTRELLRPALAEWLDANLPAMVERMVATEIARIVGKKP